MKKKQWIDSEIVKSILNRICIITKKIGHFPSEDELKKMYENELLLDIEISGGFEHIEKLMWYDDIENYCPEYDIMKGLNSFCNRLGRTPNLNEIKNIDRKLFITITNNGGFTKFKNLFLVEKELFNESVDCVIKEGLENVIEEELIEIETNKILIKYVIKEPIEHIILGRLNKISSEIGCFPKLDMLDGKLSISVKKNNGITHFKRLWSEDINNLIAVLQHYIDKYGDFPKLNDLRDLEHKEWLVSLIGKHGGFNSVRGIMGYEILKKDNGYWDKKENVIAEIQKYIDEYVDFPTLSELINSGKGSLCSAIGKHGGVKHFWDIFDVDVTERQKQSALNAPYISRKGYESESIIKDIVVAWSKAHNLPGLNFNVKIAPGKVIEFVCEGDKKIGVDATNTKSKYGTDIKRKWRKKQYHLHLDELWIVVFSNVYTEIDYIKFNEKSPDNVKVMSIKTFMDELGITVDENMQFKIDAYNKCTFHTKDELRSEVSNSKTGIRKYMKIKPDIRIMR